MRDYLTLEDVLDIHADQIAEYGGSLGIRDLGLLEAAIARPQSGYYLDLIAEGAALWESLAMNHPFIDGNKRVGFAATATFLAANGIVVTADPFETHRYIIDLLETGRFRFEALEAWLRANTR